MGQPDIAVICDAAKIDARGCRGAPAVIIEIVFPATAAKDQIHKVSLYERHGVKGYWLVHPSIRLITVCFLDKQGQYGLPPISEAKGNLPVTTIPGLGLDPDLVFKRVTATT